MQTGSSPDQEKRILELDGLRGFAILIVWCLHYFYKPMSIAPPAYQHFQNIFRLGWTGVDLFFVLSGFLIGGILLDKRDSNSYFKTFYARRFFRIIPIYYLWICGYILLVTLGGSALRQHMNSHQLIGIGFPVYEHFLFLQNIFVPEYATIFLFWFGVLWSLAVEEQFYLVVPLLVRFVTGKRLYAFVISVIVLAPLLRLYLSYFNSLRLPISPYGSTLCRADALSFGVLAALLWRENAFRSWLSRNSHFAHSALAIFGAGMLVLWYRFSDPADPFTLTAGLSWIAAFYFVLLIVAISFPEGLLARCARTSFLCELGRVSYCLYVIHFGVSYLVFGLVLRSIPRFSDFSSVALTFATAAFVYLLARLSWQYFERPMLQLGHRFTY